MSRFTIYNASAGSGKTYTLAVQYIARMLAAGRETDGAYRQVLAVTFTNKATAEMKDRILQQLYGIGASLNTSDGYLRSVSDALKAIGINMDDDTIRHESKRALSAILHDYSRFRVETIDTFFRGVLTDMARELGLPSGLKADIDSQRAISEAVDRIITRLTEDDRLRGWVTEFVAEKVNEGKRWNVASDIKQFAAHIFDAQYLECQDSLADFLCDDRSVRRLRETLDNTQQEMLGALADFLTHLEDLCSNPWAEGLKNSRYLFSHLTKVKAAIKGGVLEEPSVSVKKMAEDKANLLKAKHTTEEAEIAEDIQRALADLLMVEEKAMSVLTTIQLTRHHINPMRLLATVAKEVNDVVQERGAFLLSNTNILLDRMVADDDASFIYEKTGTVLRHIMLDEFQDTSTLQWSNFQTLINDNMAKGGSTLVVGDVKQSIYRWRGGDCGILANLPLSMQRYKPEQKTLKTNFRSTRNIIEFNNALYLNIAAQVNNLKTAKEEEWNIYDIYTREDVPQQAAARHCDDGFVQIVCQTQVKDDDPHMAATEEMCRTIDRLIQTGHKPEDMAILIRNNRDLDMVSQAFAEHLPNVPLVSDEMFSLNRSVAVSILINALRAIYHPSDTASLGRLVYLYNKEVSAKSDDLNRMFDHIDKKSPFLSACKFLPEGFANIERLRQLPIFELLVELTSMFSINDIPGQAAYLMTFYDSIVGNNDDYTLSLSGLLKYWDERLHKKSIPGGEVKGVNVLTIHRSKGLQWKTVFIPYCDWKIHDDKMQAYNIIWCRADNIPLLCGMPLVAISATKKAGQSVFADEYIHELQNQRIDNLNLLYVATTRAEQNLYIWGKCTKKDSVNPTMAQMIGDIIDRLPHGTKTENESETRYTYRNVCTNDALNLFTVRADGQEESHNAKNRLEMEYSTPPFNPVLYPALMDFKQSNEAKVFTGCTDHEVPTATQSRYINTGTALHAIFASITSVKDIAKVMSSLPISATKTEDGKDMRKTALHLIENGCRDSRVKDWFSGRHELSNECTIIERDHETGKIIEHRPDRVMISGDNIIVVDFKFGKHNDKHKNQVKKYIQLLQAMYKHKQVTGYLWYVYQNEIIEIEN